ncbi:MAG: putative peptidoglycan glycosyltransferase FtsW [Candidatus Nealsonbacteria bacterium]|nr:putative peptidoglycan glycosyltransferase FtsW [Candidatus Nealsonbacteria bacterium]
MILAGVSSIFSQKDFDWSGYYFLHQLNWAIIPGLILGFTAFFIPVSFLKRTSFGLILFALFLMAIVLIPGIGIVSGGAPRWIDVGFTTLQPSEFLKLAFIIYLATWLDSRLKEKKQVHNSKKTFVPFICILGLIFVLFYLQSNASTLILIFSIACLMYFLSGTPFWQSMLLGLGGAIGAVLLILLEPYRLNRLMISLGMIKDPMGLGYQINQSLIAIGSGGFFGTGLETSAQKPGSFLPQTMSDSIFSVFAEKMGFLGAMIVLSLFIIIFIRCIRIAGKTEDKFSQLFVIGFGSWICLQAFINIAAMIQLIPLTGIPLPFISYGGSHIIMELAGAGIVLNISKNT